MKDLDDLNPDASARRFISGWMPLFLIVASLAVTGYCQRTLLLDSLALHDDARAVVVRAALWEEPGTFEGDPFTGYAQLYVPPPLEALYRLLSPVLPAAAVTKLLPFPITLACVLCVWASLKKTRGAGSEGALLGSILFLFFLWTSWPPVLGAGDAGDLFPLFLCLYVWLAPGGSWLAIAALFVAEALVYPPALFLCGGAWVLSTLWELRAGRAAPWVRSIRGLGLLAVLGASLVAVALPYRLSTQARLGKPRTLAESRALPEFGPGGRIPLYGEGFWRSLVNDRSGFAIDGPRIFLGGLAAVTGLLAIVVWRRSRSGRRPPLPAAPHALLASGLALFVAARTVVFLYQPSRYVILTVPLWLTLAAARLLGAVAWTDPRRARRRLAVWLLCITALALPRLYGNSVTPADPGLIRTVARLPASALLAGPPDEMDDVMAFARRRVFDSAEFTVPFFAGHSAEMARRIRAFFGAYYSSDPAEIARFCQTNGVSHIVARNEDFTPERLASGPLFYEPFGTEISRAVSGRSDFALPSVGADRRIYESPWGFVLACTPAGLGVTEGGGPA